MARVGAFEAVTLIVVILLCAVLFLMVTDQNARVSDKVSWSISGDDPVSRIYMANDGSIYLFGGANGNSICAIDSNGDRKWALEVPDKWRVSKDVIAIDDGMLYLYLYAFENASAARYDDAAMYESVLANGGIVEGDRSIMAVSDSGHILWRKDVSGMMVRNDGSLVYASNGRVYLYNNNTLLVVDKNGMVQVDSADMPAMLGHFGGTSLYASNGRVYYYDNHSLVVMDKNGKVLFAIPEVEEAPTVDDQGNIYLVKQFIDPAGGFSNGRVIEAYFPNGSLYWRNDLKQPIYSIIDYKFNYQSERQFNTALVCQNGSLYAWVGDGIVRMSANGSVIWSKTFPSDRYEPLEGMPIDSQGNLYFLFQSYPQYIDIIQPNGTELLRDVVAHNATLRGNHDGVVYYVDYDFNKPIDQVTKQDLMSVRITAYDLIGDRLLWNRTITPDASELTVGEDDVEFFLKPGLARHYPIVDTTDMKTIDLGIYRQRDQHADEQTKVISPKGIVCNWGIRLAPGNDTLYMDYYAYNWQYPLVGNETKYYYANSLYAIADNGTLLWEKPLSSLITSMAVNNSTLYYSTRNGGFFVENAAKIGGGIALLAILYLAARFVVIGSVARARGRIEKNENRNSVMKYIASNPGLTARDLARSLGANLGTIRYHLFILELNHKIVGYKADGKYLRYFTNSRSYSDGQQHAVSLVRREGMGKLLNCLIEKPGLTIRELALALDTQESSVGRNLKELLQKEIVTRDMNKGGSPAYSISNQHRDNIAFALERVRK